MVSPPEPQGSAKSGPGRTRTESLLDNALGIVAFARQPNTFGDLALPPVFGILQI